MTLRWRSICFDPVSGARRDAVEKGQNEGVPEEDPKQSVARCARHAQRTAGQRRDSSAVR